MIRAYIATVRGGEAFVMLAADGEPKQGDTFSTDVTDVGQSRRIQAIAPTRIPWRAVLYQFAGGIWYPFAVLQLT